MSDTLAHRFSNRPFYESATPNEYAALSDDMRDKVLAFRRDGFLRLEKAVAEPTVDAAYRYLSDRCFESNDSAGHTVKEHRIVDAWADCDAIRHIALDSNILSLLNVLYGRRPVPFQTLNFPVGSQQRTHSDGIHFNTVPSRFMCGVWVALEDITPESGPLHYYTGSHLLPDTTLHETFDGNQQPGAYPALQDYNTCYEEYLESTLAQANYERIEVCLNKGDVFIWSAGLCHGGSPVTDPNSTRMSQVTHVFFDDCLYFSPRRSHNHIGRMWLRRVHDISAGAPVPHHFAGQVIDVPEPGPYRVDSSGALISDRAVASEGHPAGHGNDTLARLSARLSRKVRRWLPR